MDDDFVELMPFHSLTKESLFNIERRIAEDRAAKIREKIQSGSIQEEEAYDEVGQHEENPIPNPKLEAGRKIPPSFEDCPSELIGKPLDDIDEFYRNQKTFVVVNKSKHIYRFSATNAIFLLSPFNPIRRAAIYILVHPWFSMAVIMTIMINCGFMAYSDNSYDVMESIFLGIYTFESLVKIVSRGFVRYPFTYLRDPWSWLDFCVIAAAYLTLAIPELGNVSFLRTVRVFRALKTISVIPGLRTIVKALLMAVRRLRDVTILTLFVLSIFALIGMQLYSGALLRKCVIDYTQKLGHNVTHEQYSAFVNNESYWLKDLKGDYPVCGNDSTAGKCGNYTEEETKEVFQCICLGNIGLNPNSGYTGFDHFGMALLCTFRLMTQDFWESLYHLVLRAEGHKHCLYFMFVIMLGSFYLVNLILAIVAMSYDDQQKKDIADAEEKAAEKQKAEARKEAISIINRSRSNSSWNSECGRDEKLVLDKTNEKGRLSLTSAHSVTNVNLQTNTSGQIRYSLSLPDSPYVHRLNMHGSPYGRKSLNVAKLEAHSQERQSLEQDIFESIHLPFADDLTATPPSEDGVNYSISKPTMPSGHCSSLISQRWRAAPMIDGVGVLHAKSRRSSEISNYSQASSKSRNSRAVHRSKPELLLNLKEDKIYTFDKNKLDDDSISSCSGQVIEKDKASQNNIFRQSSGGLNVDKKDFMALRGILVQASQYRKSFISTTNMKQKTMKNFFWKCFCTWDCHPYFQKLQHLVSLFIMDAFADLFVTLCILANTFFLAIDHYDMDKTLEKVSLSANVVFTLIFMSEAFLKILAMSPVNYFKDAWNIFDFFIVTVSLVESCLEDTNIPGLSVMRTFRLLRVFKLAKSWPTLNKLLSIVVRTMGALGNLVIVLAIVIFIFAVMGHQLFWQRYPKYTDVNITEKCQTDQNCVPRWNFNDFTHSFMIVFRVLCGEWIESMWGCLNNCDWTCVPFFLLTYIIGNLVVLNLFLALLLSSFGSERLSDDEPPTKLSEAIDRFRRAGHWMKVKIIVFANIRKRKTILRPPSSPELPKQHEENAKKTDGTRISFENTLDPLPVEAMVSKTGSLSSAKKCLKSTSGSLSASSQCSSCSSHSNLAQVTKVDLHAEHTINEVEIIYVKEPEDCFCYICTKRCQWYRKIEKTLFGRVWWTLRCFMYRVIKHKYFDTFIIFIILSSSIALALEDVHLAERPLLKEILEYLDKIFTAIFIVEMIVKWLAFGFKTYFTNAWCWLDFCIVMISIAMMIMSRNRSQENLSAMKSMRTLRALRPLRAVSRWEGMRVVVNALFKAIPSICNVLLVCLVFWLIFGIVGVQMFNGKFHACYNGTSKCKPEEIQNKNMCQANGLNWTNAKINFDNVLVAYLALFQVATYKGWTDIMDNAVDSTNIDFQPKREGKVLYYLYFVLFIVFGSFFTLNLFIGVIIENFNSQKRKAGGSLEIFMTEDQKKYYKAMKRMQSVSPQKSIPRPKYKLAAVIFDITTDQKFDILIMVIIILNMLTMMFEFHGMSNEMKQILSVFNLIFITIFTAECVLKLFGLRWYYFKVPWNVFDFVVIILSIVVSSLPEDDTNYLISPTLLRVIRVFRIGRVLRLVKSAKGIRTLLFSLAVSLPALFNIGLLLTLIMFIYAIIGMNIFQGHPKEFGCDDVFNFDTFISSFILLFQMSTSAGWSDVLNALIADCPAKGSCTDYNKATLYLATYLIISFLVVVNMYIAVILENFNQATEDVQQGLTPDDFDLYYEKWEKFDPEATKYIPLNQLSDFVDYLEEPLRLSKPNHFLLVKLDIPICEDDRCYCRDILDALAKNVLGTSETMDIPQKETDKDKLEYTPISSTLRRQKDHYAAWIIQKVYRYFKGTTCESNDDSSYSKDIDAKSEDEDTSSSARGVDTLSMAIFSHFSQDCKNGESCIINYQLRSSNNDVLRKDMENQGKHTIDNRKADSYEETNDNTSVKLSEDWFTSSDGQTEALMSKPDDAATIIFNNENESEQKTVELGPNSAIVA